MFTVAVKMLQSVKGLRYLHDQSPALVHGDIKGVSLSSKLFLLYSANANIFICMKANILVNDNGKACLTDFGFISISESQLVQTTFKIGDGGTLRWTAPELFDDTSEGVQKSRASDIYAFGMTVSTLR